MKGSASGLQAFKNAFGQARKGKGWQSRRKALKLKPLPRAYIKVSFSTSKHKANTTELHPKVRQTCSEYSVCAGGQRRAADVAAGGRAVAADGDREPRHQVRLPQPARGLHEDDLLQTLDREGHRTPLLSCDRYSSLDTILKIDIYTVDICKCVSFASSRSYITMIKQFLMAAWLVVAGDHITKCVNEAGHKRVSASLPHVRSLLNGALNKLHIM